MMQGRDMREKVWYMVLLTLVLVEEEEEAERVAGVEEEEEAGVDVDGVEGNVQLLTTVGSVKKTPT
jgi:hypothetical protein